MNKNVYWLGRAYGLLASAYPPAAEGDALAFATEKPLAAYARMMERTLLGNALPEDTRQKMMDAIWEVSPDHSDPTTEEERGDWLLGYQHGSADKTVTKRDLLKRANVTQVQVANHLGVNKSAIHAWLEGKSAISAENEKKIADFIGCQVEDFQK